MTNPLISDPPQVKYISADVQLNKQTPFLAGQPIYVDSLAGTTLYGANLPGDLDASKYAKFKQTVSGNTAFVLPADANTPDSTIGGAIAAADQLRTVVLVDRVPALGTRADALAAAGKHVVAAGGGTAAGEAVVVDGVNAVGAILLNVKRGDAGTETILVGDTLEIAGDDTVYYCTETSQALNGTTAVAVSITPPLVAATAGAEVVTITAADGKTVLLGTAPAVGADIEVAILDAADIVTVGNDAGALTAGRVYDGICTDVMHSAGNVNISKAMR
jgi:hypothetical protein